MTRSPDELVLEYLSHSKRPLKLKEIARGLANYSAAETRLIARKPSSQIEAALGYAGEPEMIHRDNLVLSA